jgi:hypothetical protein
MYAFEYQKVTTVADAAAKVAANPEAKLLAGGQSLIASMKLRLANPGQVIDLGTVPELRGIKVDASGVTIGAMTRHAEVAASAEVKKAIPALADLAGTVLAEALVDLDVDHRADAALSFVQDAADDLVAEAGIPRGRLLGAAVAHALELAQCRVARERIGQHVELASNMHGNDSHPCEIRPRGT